MNINELTIGQAKEIAALVGAALSTQKSVPSSHIGYSIVVLDRSFVYVGDVTREDDFIVINNAQNIRWWGTERGLGQLALEGPTSKTKLDPCGVLRAPLSSLISLIATEEQKWNR